MAYRDVDARGVPDPAARTGRRTTIKGRDDCRPDERGFRALLGEETDIRGGGLDYALDPVFRANETCGVTGVGQGIIRVTSTDPANYRHVACSARPGTGPPQYDASFEPTSSNTICRTSVRLRAPRPPVKPRDVTVLRRAPRCTRRTRARGRRLRVRLTNPANEPVRTAVVRVGRRVIYRYEYPGRLRRSLVVRLPRRAARVRVAVRTTSNKTLASGRRYAKCARR